MKANKEVAVFYFFALPIRNNDDFIRGRNSPATAITACCYHKTAHYYSRIVAIFGRRSMLFSGGDFPGTLSSILSGEGFDEGEQGESPFKHFDPR